MHLHSLPPRSVLINDWLPNDEARAGVSEGISWLNTAASSGDFEAQCWLAHLIGNGRGVTRDKQAAFRWYRSAAENDHAGAVKFALANLYMTGTGTQQNSASALRWYLDAAQDGDCEAQQTIGHIYAQGEIVEREYAEAAKWLKAAAEQERRRLEQLRKHDYYPESDIYSFDLWALLTEKASKGCEESDREIGAYYKWSLDFIAKDEGRFCPTLVLSRFNHGEMAGWRSDSFQSDQIERARSGVLAAQLALGLGWIDGSNSELRQEARGSLLAAAEQGNTLAMRVLGDGRRRIIAGTELREASEKESAGWYRRAAELGDAEAQYQLADRLILVAHEKTYGPQSLQFDVNGSAIWPNEYREAAEWFRKAAEQGHARAQERLAKMLIDGRMGVTANKGEGLCWRRLAATNGYAVAQKNLAEMYASGDGIPSDDEQAVILFMRAGAADDVMRAYRDGKGVARDGAEAMIWHRRCRY